MAKWVASPGLMVVQWAKHLGLHQVDAAAGVIQVGHLAGAYRPAFDRGAIVRILGGRVTC